MTSTAQRSPGKDVQRSRSRFARRQWARRWLAWKYVVAVVVVLALVGGTVYTVYFSSALAVEGVQVRGNDQLSVEDVRRAADVPTGGALAALDLRAIELRVGSLATVESVEVSRSWPNDVVIDIDERRAVAVVEMGGQLRSLDRSGAVFGSYRRAPSNLPLVETSIGTDSDALREAAKVVSALPDEVALTVDHVEVETVDQITLELGDGRLVRWGSADGSTRKGEVLLALLSRRAQVYDVSVPGQPTTSGG